ncbi:F-actin-capping protein subunit beta [Coniochaeta pulveracea]|uniref:F-actin-capping protein subunit beta n=1 Tax=Coniochaeta pulveracea TaxID=177199 RepID=A0A420XXR2_9PEZI|nr:F-actin-capping protein subunit beta [Coniochaeta pulveracea]
MVLRDIGAQRDAYFRISWGVRSPGTSYGRDDDNLVIMTYVKKGSWSVTEAELMPMWRIRLEDVDPITGSSGAAVLCAVLTQNFYTRPVELRSEFLCWLILPMVFTAAKPPDAVISSRHTLSGCFRPQDTSLAAIWLVSMSIVSASLYKQELGMITCLH